MPSASSCARPRPRCRPEPAVSFLIIGCGYLGVRVAARCAAGGEPLALVSRDAARARVLGDGFSARTFVGDYHSPALLDFAAVLPPPLHVFCLLPPGGCADAAGTLAPLQRLVAMLATLAPASAILSSSTGVYGDAARTVTAESSCLASGPRERRLAEIEACWLELPVARVLRLAGLYGPGRIVGLAGVRAGAPVAGDPDAWLNLIHIEDAAALLLRMTARAGARVELGSDGTPVTRRDYYRTLAATAGAPPPGFDFSPTVRGAAYRRCDPSSTRGRLEWWPMFRDFRAGLAVLGDEITRG
jgi:nucleoside-diphosphate-sugar epimerase